MPSPACRSAFVPLSARVRVRLPGVIVTLGLPAPWAHLMLRAAMVSFPVDAFSRGRRRPNTLEPEHVSEFPAFRRFPDTDLPASGEMLSPPVTIRLRIW